MTQSLINAYSDMSGVTVKIYQKDPKKKGGQAMINCVQVAEFVQPSTKVMRVFRQNLHCSLMVAQDAGGSLMVAQDAGEPPFKKARGVA